MGLGKTVQLLALLLAEREHRAGGRKRLAPTLLVCPMSVVGNWEREAERFAPSLRVHVHHGRERLAGRTFARAARASDLVVTTYALATRDNETLGAIKWERIALDEAQNIKNGDGAADARDSRAAGTPSRRADRHAGREPPRRAALDHGLPQPRLARVGRELPVALLDADRALPRRGCDGLPATGDGPFILRRLKTDKDDHRRPAGEDRDEGRLPPDARAGDALQGGRRRDARARPPKPRGSSAAGSCSRR